MRKSYRSHNELIQLFQYIEELINQSGDVFWIRSPDYSNQLYVSPAYEKIWGSPCENLYKQPERWINSILPEDQKRIENNLEERSPDVIAGQKFLQWYRVARPDGQIRWIEDESFAIFDNEGDHIGFAGIATDVTEKKENEIYLQKEKLRAEAVSKSKSEFIANMSHDIKTPLSGMIGMTDILIPQLKGSKQIECAKAILDAGHTLMKFVENCLGVVLSENSEIIFNKELFSLKSVFEDIFCLFQPAAKSKDLSFTINYVDKNPNFFLGSRAAIYRILLNLVGNAIKFTPAGSVNLGATISKNPSFTKQCIVKFIVEDTGIGIAKDDQKTIFERYTRLSPSYERLYEGAGIGLSIVKKFVEELGGEIRVTSQKGKGSCFLVVLPLEIPLLQAEEYGEQSRDPIFSSNNVGLCLDGLVTQTLSFTASITNERDTLSKVRILLVEDNIIAQKIAELILIDLSCEVHVADCGQKAIELFSQNKYDLAFIDIGLPDVSGYAVIKEIRKIESEQEQDPSIPIFILTAHATYDAEKNCASSGSQEILSKPLSKEKAREVIERYVINKNKIATVTSLLST